MIAPEPPCKRVLALLAATPEWPAKLCAELEEAFGPIDYRSPFQPFEDGGYYATEMGGPLWRGWVSFRGLESPAGLTVWALRARMLEHACALNERRLYNLDIGYLDADKLVLASRKSGPFKLYLGEGVWADILLGYSRGAFSPTPWAFPDFRDGRYDRSLAVIREKLKADMHR